jgi:hypothetical protein
MPSTDFISDMHTNGSKVGGVPLKFYLRNGSRAVDTFCYRHKDKENKFGHFTIAIINLAAIFMIFADSLFLSATLKNGQI